MTSWKVGPVRRCAAVTASALSLGCLVAMAAAPATAASGTLVYDCQMQGLTGVFTAAWDTDAPATMSPGQTASPTVTGSIVLPPVIVEGSRFAGITTIDGNTTATITVDGVDRTAPLTIPMTPVPATGSTMTVVGTGPGGTIQAGNAGTGIALGAGSFSTLFRGYNSMGNKIAEGTWSCTLQPNQALGIDAVAVLAPTTTTITVASPVEYGDTPAVTADVAVAGSSAKPSGSVEFTFGGTTVKADLKAGKAKATLGQALAMGAQTVTAKFVPSDTTSAPSEASKSVTVVRGPSSTAAHAAYRATRRRLVGNALVEAVHGTDVTGKVKFVLKRDGLKIRSAVVALNAHDKVRTVFKHIGKPGHYRLFARYLGSGTLKRSDDAVKIVL